MNHMSAPIHILLYKFISLASFEKNISEWALKASLAHDVNDPLENIPQGKGGNEDKGICIPPFFSFSRQMSVPAMWGHYADNAKGICMAFLFPVVSEDFKEWPSETSAPTTRLSGAKIDIQCLHPADKSQLLLHKNTVLLPMMYSDTRARAYSPRDNGRLRDEKTESIMRIKALCWRYEQEIRLLCDVRLANKCINDNLLFSWPMQFFIGAITGPKCHIPVEVLKQKICLAYKQNSDSAPNYYFRNKLLNDWLVYKSDFHPKEFKITAPFFSDSMCDYAFWKNLQENNQYVL